MFKNQNTSLTLALCLLLTSCSFHPQSLHMHSCSVLPPVSSSDHNSILVSIPVRLSLSTSHSPHQVWLYDQAANSILSSIPWEEILPTSCPETSWMIFKELFLRTMHITIPTKTVYPSISSLHPWLNCTALKLIKRRNSLFRAARCSGSPTLMSNYHRARNQVVTYILKKTQISILPLSFYFHKSSLFLVCH